MGLTALFLNPEPTTGVDDLPIAESLPGVKTGPVQHQTRLREAEVLNLIADYLSGDNIRAVARKYHVDQHTAGAHLDRHGIEHRPQGQILPAKLEEAARRYNAGENIVAVAKFLKVHPETARKALVRAGVTIRPA